MKSRHVDFQSCLGITILKVAGSKFRLSYTRSCTQAQVFERTRAWYPESRLILRIKGQFCYVDVLEEGEASPSPLARLRYFRDNAWSMAFFTWSHERYEPTVFFNGAWEGTLEQAIETCEPFIS
ncbi:MAG: hypothetical protein MN733_06215, partial [Nitrososphaera sp.]|nr:hypothetical protein [Nitrososphaera sp.]